MSDDLHVLSAGAIEPGLLAAVDAFRDEHGRDVRITWATTPVIGRRLAGGETPDVVIASGSAMEDFARERRIDGEARVSVGRVGIGVAVREDAPAPDVATEGALRYAVLDADSVVFNTASSGLYVERMLAELGLLDRIRSKTTRYANGPAMMEHLIEGRVKGKEIGFGALVEIMMFRDKGLRLVGPLPPSLQHYTEYVAAPLAAAPDPEGAQALVDHLGSARARALFAEHGID